MDQTMINGDGLKISIVTIITKIIIIVITLFWRKLYKRCDKEFYILTTEF